MDDRQEVVGGLLRSYLFEGMTVEQIEPLANVSATRRLVRGEYVWHAGDPANELYVVMLGEVKDCVVDINGHEVIHFTHGPGMTLGEPGFFSQEHYRILDSIAMKLTTVIRLARADLCPFLERHGAVKDRIMEALASDLRWQTNLITSILTRPLTERLVLLLLEQIDSPREAVGSGRHAEDYTVDSCGHDRSEPGERESGTGCARTGWLYPYGGRPVRAGRREAATARGRPGVACRAAPRPAR